MTFVGERKPISQLVFEHCIADLNLEYSSISTKFQMFRSFDSSCLSFVSNFGYLEHILRMTTSKDERTDCFMYMAKALRNKLQTILKQPFRTQIENQLFLESISESDLAFLSNPPIKIVLYTYENNEYIEEEICPTYDNRWSVCYILNINYNLFMLYTSTINFLDGFDPYTGDCNDAIIPHHIIEKALTELYHESCVTIDDGDSLKTEDYEYPSPTENSPTSSRFHSPIGFQYMKLAEMFKPESPHNQEIYDDSDSDIEEYASYIIGSNKPNLLSEAKNSYILNKNAEGSLNSDVPNLKVQNVQLLNDSDSYEMRLHKRSCCGENCNVF